MLLTQKQSYTCSKCGHVYRGQEGLKHNSRTGEERVVWKKIKVGGEVLKFGQWDENPSFECIQCHSTVEV